MIRSMSTAVTGLRGHQQKLDVIGNNIANVNTVAFKKSQARFEDLLSQTIQGATAPLTRGGINPSQVGMGMRVSSIVDIHFQGAITNTDRETDLAIEGEGFFIVSDGARVYYTRDGSFGRDAAGELVNANGLKLMGWREEGGELEPMHIPLGERMVARPSQNLGFAGNLDARSYRAATAGFVTGAVTLDNAAINALASAITIEFTVDGGTMQSMSLTAGEMGGITTQAQLLTAINDGIGAWVGLTGATASFDTNNNLVITSSSTGDTSTVQLGGTDYAQLFGASPSYSDGLAEVADQYTYEYYVYDSLGRRYAVDYTFTPQSGNTWNYNLSVSDEGGTDVPIATGATGQLVYTPLGALNVAASNIPDVTFTPPPLAAGLVIDQDFEMTTQLAGMNSLLVREQDGYAAGELVAFYISRTGSIVGTYTNGMVEELGQIAMGFFSNPEGLIKEGGNLYMETANSGEVRVGTPGTEGRGLISSSSLEMSNTDLAFEFTELITTSRAFQANTRVVTTSDEVLVEVINMKR
jgi:flagellar hook protein FlgE